MNCSEINKIVKEYKEELGIKIYAPAKYFRGLSKPQIKKRLVEMKKGSTKPYKTDANVKTRESRYTKRFKELYGDQPSLRQKATASGAPLNILKKVYDRGLKAWQTGHRPGASAQQWGYARVHSFLTLGCTAISADFGLFKEMVNELEKTKKGQSKLKIILSNEIKCEKEKLQKPYYKNIGGVEYVRNLRKKYKN